MRPIIDALSQVRGFKLTHRSEMLLGTVPGLFVRVLPQPDVILDSTHPRASLERRWVVQMAESKTFDRWANSTNFETQVWWSRKGGWTVPDFAREFTWCRKVCRSGLFHFPSYFATITTPWFIHPRKRS